MLALPAVTGNPLGDTLIYLAAVLVAAGTIARYVWPTLQGAYRLIKTIEQGAVDYHQSGGFGGLAAEISAIKEQLHPNGGSSLRDAVDQAAREARVAAVEAARIGAVTEAVDRRLAEVREVVDAQAGRITEHRRRQDETVRELREFIESRYHEALTASEYLRAGLAEALAVDRERLPEPPDDHLPDL